MSQARPIPPPGFDELSVEEQINYVEALWVTPKAFANFSPGLERSDNPGIVE